MEGRTLWKVKKTWRIRVPQEKKHNFVRLHNLSVKHKEITNWWNSLLHLGRKLWYHSSLSVQNYKDCVGAITLTSVAATNNYNNTSPASSFVLLKKMPYISRLRGCQIPVQSKLSIPSFHELPSLTHTIQKFTIVLSESAQQLLTKINVKTTINWGDAWV